MPEYQYQAKKGLGQVVNGVVSAANPQEAIKLIEVQGLLPIEIVLKTAPDESAKPAAVKSVDRPEKKSETSSVFQSRKISAYQVCIFTRQLAGFLRTGVPLLRALDLIREQASDKKMKAILSEVVNGVRNGDAFSFTLEKFAIGSFDARYLSMVASGELGGSLDRVLEVLADHLESEEELRGQIRAAMAYPLFILLVGIGTLFFLLMFCLPRLSGLFSSHGKLPFLTQVLMGFSNPACQVGLWIFFGLLGLGAAYLFRPGLAAKRTRDGLLLKLPFISSLACKSDIARFCSTLSMLIENGIQMHQAVEAARPVLANELLKEDLKQAQRHLLEGGMLTDVLKEARYFPPLVHQLIAVGEESGQLPRTLSEVARFYTRESLRGVKMLTSLLEPLFILGLSVIVGLIVAGIMLPIFDMGWVH